MSQFYKFTQGVEEQIRVYTSGAILIIKNPTTILTFNTVEAGETEDEYWLKFTIDQDNYIEGGIAQYQLFEDNVLKEYGSCQIIPSLLVNPEQDLRGKYQQIVDAIEAMLAGVATKGQRHVQVGDKTVEKYSAAELLSLLNYFQGKLAEEESGTDVNTKTDQLTVKYYWRGF